jgi:hypothetical protein
MVSSPKDVVELNVDEEKQRLDHALESLVKKGYVEVVWLERATLRELLQALERHDIHIFHYIGHGAFDEREGDGVLMLEDEQGRGKPVTGMYLGQLLADERTLRLAVLNACEGARTGSEDPFAGVAASLVKNEIPSVVAMQFEITDEAAILFAGGFYSALARGLPVDAAIASARKAIWADYNDIEWATPVLFMRIPDGRIFDLRTESVDLIGEDDFDQPILDAELVPSPTAVMQGEEVAWRLTVMNPSKTDISGLTALRDDGSMLEATPELAPGRRSVTTWRTRPETDVEATVTVSAVDVRGDRITEQVSAHVTVHRDSTSAALTGEAIGQQAQKSGQAAEQPERQRGRTQKPEDLPPLHTLETTSAPPAPRSTARSPLGSRRLPRRGILLMALAGVLAGAVSILVFTLGGGSPGPTSPVRDANQAGAVVASIPLGQPDPQSVAVGESEVWVGHPATVGRVDPDANEVVGEPINVGRSLLGGLAVGENFVWVVLPSPAS